MKPFPFRTFSLNISLINSYLLAAVFFFIPVKIGPAYIFSGILLVFWLLEGNLHEKWLYVKRQYQTWIFWLYFIIPFISLIWSSDILWGIMMAKRGIFFLFFPLYAHVVRKEHVLLYIGSFLTSLSITMLLAYYKWFQIHDIHDLTHRAHVVNNDYWQIAPFINSIMYNPILAFGAYLVGYLILFTKQQLYIKLFYSYLLLLMTINMYISGGRAGQVGFVVMMGLLIFQYFARRFVLAFLLASAVMVGVFMAGYYGSETFKERADLAVTQLLDYQRARNTPAALRVNFAVNTWRMVLESPVLGVGIGDYPMEYARINKIHTPEWWPTVNPHNQFLFALSTTGLIGGISLIAVLYGPACLARSIRDEWSGIRTALPLLFTVICFAESYLWRSNTGLMFVAFSSILYADNAAINIECGKEAV